ncbi:hypothetical protein M427DRAFT_132895 [Gonapodya prolifera JEL478]|uniref:Ras-GEF domain-containing protein n=1 Tax=Gonapodya prolifera (strain JEL478) TaxID=1344416 RepID=A0A139AMY0_GONPJ|nr:hypothetical protein M427DRAFT_132895 [Gonapodya prolifera JEL478]|eukprot:KXS18120.1 hypothetical protein M427DRAFT_132895 [Gonapodya prolifera JEL478]
MEPNSKGDWDESRVRKLLHQAEEEVAKENFKDAFVLFLRAANSGIHSIGTSAAWEGQRVLKTAPSTSRSLFELSRRAISRAEEVFKARPVEERTGGDLSSPVPFAVPQLPNFLQDTPILLPIVPTSPLSKNVVTRARDYHAALKKVAVLSKQQGLNGKPKSPDLGALRRVHEVAQTEKRRLDAAVEAVTKFSSPEFNILSFTPQVLAKELAALDTQLFKTLFSGEPDLRDSLILGALHDHSYSAALDTKLHSLRACLDLHKYLRHVFVDTILSATPENRNVTAAAARAHVIQHLVATGTVLQRVYRSYPSVAAIVLALSNTTVRRLRLTWALVDGRWREWVERVAAVFTKQQNKADAKGWDLYFAELKECLEIYYNPPIHTVTPWLYPFTDTLRDLTRLYGLAAEQTPSQGKPSIALTESASASMERILSLCAMTHGSAVDTEAVPGWMGPHHPLSRRPSPAPPGMSVPSAGLRWTGRDTTTGKVLPGQITQDLGSVATDPNVRHWLVTRVYVGERELWERSVAVEPQRSEADHPGEEIEWEEHEARSWQGVMERAVELASYSLEEKNTSGPSDTTDQTPTLSLAPSEQLLENPAEGTPPAAIERSTDAVLEHARSGIADVSDADAKLMATFAVIPATFEGEVETAATAERTEIPDTDDISEIAAQTFQEGDEHEIDRELAELEMSHGDLEGGHRGAGERNLQNAQIRQDPPRDDPLEASGQEVSLPLPPTEPPPQPLQEHSTEESATEPIMDLDFLDQLTARSPSSSASNAAISPVSGSLIEFEGIPGAGSASRAPPIQPPPGSAPALPPKPFSPHTGTLPTKSSLTLSSNGSSSGSLDQTGKPKKKVRIVAEGDYVPGPWEDDEELVGIVGDMGIGASSMREPTNTVPGSATKPNEDQYSELWKRLGALGGSSAPR